MLTYSVLLNSTSASHGRTPVKPQQVGNPLGHTGEVQAVVDGCPIYPSLGIQSYVIGGVGVFRQVVPTGALIASPAQCNKPSRQKPFARRGVEPVGSIRPCKGQPNSPRARLPCGGNSDQRAKGSCGPECEFGFQGKSFCGLDGLSSGLTAFPAAQFNHAPRAHVMQNPQVSGDHVTGIPTQGKPAKPRPT
ncbi:hypothetical protein Bbelb_028060 [Branchiostoma belcheri]|nr:hypothetical protein Bbelb_028060 [Branchiostoma belcheri]